MKPWWIPGSVRFATEMFEAIHVCCFKYHWVKTACPESILTLLVSLPQNTTGSRGLDNEWRSQAEEGVEGVAK